MPREIFRVGECCDCGACCYIYSKVLGHFHVCEHYTNLSSKHCTVYANRPAECRSFPKYPMDLERVWRWCSFRFVDENGRVVDPYMEKDVKLTPTS